jgi:hypothetical protein
MTSTGEMHGMQEDRGFESHRLHPLAQVRGQIAGGPPEAGEHTASRWRADRMPWLGSQRRAPSPLPRRRDRAPLASQPLNA